MAQNFLWRCILSVLPCAHLYIQDAGPTEASGQVLQDKIIANDSLLGEGANLYELILAKAFPEILAKLCRLWSLGTHSVIVASAGRAVATR